MKNGLLSSFTAAAGLLFAAHATTPALSAAPADPRLDGNCNAGVTSNYTIAGISQNRDRPSAMVVCEAQHNPSGLYATFFVAQGVDPQLFNGAAQEIDLSLGARKKLAGGIVDVAYENFLYPGQNGTANNTNTRRAAATYSRYGLAARY
ncbi:MAG: hypothetical protein M3N08_00345 [Pseudomonadota bacterium]|nr:hypothetical protein [Pseudomonadota bacterium]